MMLPRRFRDRFVLLQVLSDLLAVAAGLRLAYWVRFESPLMAAGQVSANYPGQFWWALALWLLCLFLAGSFVVHPRVISFNRARRILRASALAILLIAVRNYFFRDLDVSRALYPIAFITVTALIVLFRLGLQVVISKFFLTRGVRSRVLIVGLNPVGFRLAARFRKHLELGYDLVGFVSLEESKVGSTINRVPVLGGPDDLRRLIRDNGVHEVFVTQTDNAPDSFFQMFLDSAKETARISFVPSLVEMMRSNIHYDEVAGVPIYSMRETPLQGANAFVKRAFDLVAASVGMVLLLPVFAILGLIVRRTSPGPVLYKQTRLGLDGKEFKIYKFRTMQVDAEKDGPGWGGQDDQRATPIGRFLRRWNLDELPQLWNVIRGDMSLVGPRPERPHYVDQFRELLPRYTARHTVKTGLTGWAQVHGLRGDTSVPQRLRYDLYYIENWSLWLDIKILMMTFMVTRKGRRRMALRAQARGAHTVAEIADHSWEENQSCPSRLPEGPHGLGEPAGVSAAPSPSASHAPER
jgi:exopolysaccharide biosynthesis polyprenyl glycosylphosphotransferase